MDTPRVWSQDRWHFSSSSDTESETDTCNGTRQVAQALARCERMLGQVKAELARSRITITNLRSQIHEQRKRIIELEDQVRHQKPVKRLRIEDYLNQVE